MTRELVVVSLSATLFACGPKPVSTGPFYATLALERWHRSDPAKEITMTALSAFHRDGRLPSATSLDEHCILGEGNWESTKFRPPSFGPITMKVADRKQVAWTETGEGAFYNSPAPEWDTGDRLEVSATGGEAPGFQVEAVVPPQVVLTSHDFAAARADTLRISRSVQLDLAWNPTQGDVYLLFLQFPLPDGTSKLRGIWCSWPATPGAVSVPSSVLQNLQASSAGIGTNIYFGGGTRQVLDLEGVELDVVVFKNEAARVQID